MIQWWDNFLQWATQYQSNIVFSVLVLLVYLVMSKKLLPKIENDIAKSKLTLCRLARHRERQR